ncbi:MAG: DUF2752 domain-containing protein, partial [Alphaproteobacteria bacterium]|nr:DUF2752 domain-containing protein [Candidatus Nitrobium versatile]
LAAPRRSLQHQRQPALIRDLKQLYFIVDGQVKGLRLNPELLHPRFNCSGCGMSRTLLLLLHIDYSVFGL